MNIKNIIRKNLIENHDLIRHDDSTELLTKATDSLADAIRYLECLSQKIENKHCMDVLVRLLDILRHPMGSVSDGNFDHKDESNILAMLEVISSIIAREKLGKTSERDLYSH